MAFHDDQAVVDRDAQSLAARLAQHYRLLDFSPRHGWERRFLHRSSSARVGSLHLTCGYTSPIQGRIGERAGVGSVNLCRAGSASYRIGRAGVTIQPARPLFFCPGFDYRYEADHFNGVVFDLDLQRLRATAAAMAGPAVAESRYLGDLQRPLAAIEAGGPQAAAHLRLLRHLFALVDPLGPIDAGTLQVLPIDDLIYRVMALLLLPRLDPLLQSGEDGDTAPRSAALDELLAWIAAHLHRPISLTELEQRSGSSRRSLQLAFRQRFGCGPIQWIRRQRLEQIRQALLHPDPQTSVSAIAARFGYSSLSALSRDVRSQFGLSPSELLRQGRRLRD